MMSPWWFLVAPFFYFTTLFIPLFVVGVWGASYAHWRRGGWKITLIYSIIGTVFATLFDLVHTFFGRS